MFLIGKIAFIAGGNACLLFSVAYLGKMLSKTVLYSSFLEKKKCEFVGYA